jgi:hypothetical protein
MEQSHSWEANSHLASQEVLWHLRVHYCFHKSTKLEYILSQMNSDCIQTQYFLKVHFSYIFSGPRSCKWHLQVLWMQFCMHHIYVVCLMFHDLITLTIFDWEHKLLNSTLVFFIFYVLSVMIKYPNHPFIRHCKSAFFP